jgi:hypothetical protein
MGECWKQDTEMPVKQVPWEWSNSPHGRVELRNHDYHESTDIHANRQDLVLSSQFPGLRWPRQPSDWLPLMGVAAALGLLLPGMWWLIGSSTSKVFLLDPIRTFIPAVAPPQPPDAAQPYVLALGPVGAGKSAWLEWEGIAQPIKMATLKDVDKAVDSTRYVLPGATIAIDHFEHRLDDAQLTEQKLALLERLVFTEKRPTLIVSSVHPLHYLVSGSNAPDGAQLARWAGVLRRFEIRPFGPAVSSGPDTETLYRAIWTRCADDEKLMLVHLAQGAFVSPKGEDTLRQLRLKGLIVDEPHRFADPEFRRFILSTYRQADVRRWERAGGKGWHEMRTGFIMLLAGATVILFFGQRDVLNTWIPYVTGLAGSMASLYRAIEGLRGSHE